MNKKEILVIIVTYNSELFLDNCLREIDTDKVDVTVVDNNSKDKSYLKRDDINVILLSNNYGFAKANNIGLKEKYNGHKYVCFLNPDVFVSKNTIEYSVDFMENHPEVGIYSGQLEGFDITTNSPTKLIDSRGIYQSWYGKWYDKDQGEKIKVTGSSLNHYNPTAICGAFMFCRSLVLFQLIRADTQLFDESFFMYKEDIDLSLRVKKKGFKLILDPSLRIYHCRGWKSRPKMSKISKIMSAKNEIKLNFRFKPHYLPYSLLKYLYVKILE
jgi:N-acetylglucosaminyl-diphospho-decaprenol L-rhamnosyltransferase